MAILEKHNPSGQNGRTTSPTPPINLTSMFQWPSLDYQIQLSVMGEQLLFQTNHLPFLQTAEQAFSQFPPAENKSEPPLILQLLIHSPQENAHRQPSLTAHSHQHLLTLSAGQHNFVTADLRQGYAFGYISQSLAQNLAYVRYSFIEAAVQAMLGLSRGFVAIHAAAVVKNDTCLLLCGPSGTGKSTLAYACLRSGCLLLSEDVVQANVAGDETILWGMPWKCHLLAESLRFFPELQGKQEQLLVNGKWKAPINLAEAYPDSMITNARNGRLVFLEKSKPDTPAALTPLTPAQARANFEAIWSWEIGWKTQYEQRLNSLFHSGAYHLQLGRTPDESVNALEKIWPSGNS